MTATLWLRPNRERSLLRRHPWIFSGGVARVDGDPGPGETVCVKSSAGVELGWAAYSPASQIRARMWTFQPGERVDAEMVASRIVASAARRAALLGVEPGGAPPAHGDEAVVLPSGAVTGFESGPGVGVRLAGDLGGATDSARLVFSEADDVPGLIADRYGDTVVCQLTTAGAERWRDVVVDALGGLVGVRSVFERSDADVRDREGLEPRIGLAHGATVPAELIAHEGRWRFGVDVAGGHKTGFYLDQRHARRTIELLAPGRRVLNVFAYTGAFSVIAVGCGAASVLSIDSSGPALAVAARNGELNGVDVGELLEADAFTALRGLRDRARQYDLIVLDPPKFANSEAQLDRASRAYKDLNLLAIKLLAPGGVLLTFSCSGAMSMELFQKVVAGAALDAGRTVRIIGRLHQPGDHPVPLAFPEAEYLKGLVLEAG